MTEGVIASAVEPDVANTQSLCGAPTVVVPLPDLTPLARALQDLAAKLTEVGKLAESVATIRTPDGYAYRCDAIAEVGRALKELRRTFRDRVCGLAIHRRLCASVGIVLPPEDTGGRGE